MASRWPHRFFLAAVISRSTSASVRYSRVRRSALGGRVGVTVRFTVAGVTSLRCDFAMALRPPRPNDCSYNDSFFGQCITEARRCRQVILTHLSRRLA